MTDDPRLDTMAAVRTCPACGGTSWCGGEYLLTDRDHYDGISQWTCLGCGNTYGRWSGRLLRHGEHEPRYGGTQ